MKVPSGERKGPGPWSAGPTQETPHRRVQHRCGVTVDVLWGKAMSEPVGPRLSGYDQSSATHTLFSCVYLSMAERSPRSRPKPLDL